MMGTSNTTGTTKNRPSVDGIVNSIWAAILGFLEIVLEIIKGAIIVVGIIAANVADFAFGAMAGTILFGGTSLVFWGYKSWQIAGLISVSTSAVQIILWGYLKRMGFRFSDIFNFSKLSGNVKIFLSTAILIWIGDTILDVSPIALMVSQSDFQQIEWLYNFLVFIIFVLVILICGFSEPLTANIRELIGDRKTGDARTRYRQQDTSKKSTSSSRRTRKTKRTGGAETSRLADILTGGHYTGMSGRKK